MKFQTALRLKLENFIHWLWTLGHLLRPIIRLREIIRLRDLARRLDPGRVLLLSTIFFRLAFLRFLTKISIFREGRVHVRKERKMTWVKNEQN